MSGRLTLWGAGQLLRTYFGRTAEPPPFFYLALIREVPPTPYVSGAELDEPLAEDGYARVAIPNEALSFNADEGTLHIISNAEEIPFVTAINNWGRIAFWALCNAEVEGYVLLTGEMESEQIIEAGDQAVIDVDELVVELGPFFTDEEF